MSSRVQSPSPSDSDRRLASQSPSPVRRPSWNASNSIRIDGDKWYNGNRVETSGGNGISMKSFTGNGSMGIYNEQNFDSESSYDMTLLTREVENIVPPIQIDDGFEINYDENRAAAGLERNASSFHVSRETQKSQKSYQYSTAELSNRQVGEGSFMGPIGKGRGRLSMETSSNFVIPPSPEGRGKGRGMGKPDGFGGYSSPGNGHGVTPTHYRGSNGRGISMVAEPNLAGGDFRPTLPPPSDFLKPRGNARQFQDIDGCCGDVGETPARQWNGPSPRVQKDFKIQAQEYWQIGKKDFGDARFIDSHCHLDLLLQRDSFNGPYSAYMKKRKETWARCYEGCIADFCYPRNFEGDKSLWESLMEESNVYLAFGCHPSSAREYNDDAEKIIVDRLSHPRTVAFGEMGLDYLRAKTQQEQDLQKDVFKKQLNLAIKHDKPLLIHCREAENDCYKIMKEIVPHNYRIHRHCFTGSLDDSRQWTDYFTNLKMGLTTGIYRPRENQWSLLRGLSMDRILIETDSPYFLPLCYSQKAEFGNLRWNHPGLGYIVAAKLAEVRNLEMKDVLIDIRKNTKTLYGI